MKKRKIASGEVFTITPGKELFNHSCPDCGHTEEFYYSGIEDGQVKIAIIPEPKSTGQHRRQKTPRMINGKNKNWVLISKKEYNKLLANTEGATDVEKK